MSFSDIWIRNYLLVVEYIIASPGHYKKLRWQFLKSKTFNLYTTDSVENSTVVPYMEVFLIDSWDQKKRQTNYVSRTNSLLVNWLCSTWRFSLDHLTPICVNLLLLIVFLRHGFWRCWSNWNFFWLSLSSYKVKFVPIELFPKTSCFIRSVSISKKYIRFPSWKKLIGNSVFGPHFLLFFLSFFIGLSIYGIS